MTTAARIWNNSSETAETPADRMHQYERILGQIATGVFILEPVDPREPKSLSITFVNEMGAKFFGRAAGTAEQVLDDADT